MRFLDGLAGPLLTDDVPFAIEDEGLRAYASELGVPALSLEEAAAAAPPAVVVYLTSRDHHRVELAQRFPRTRMLLVNQGIYDGSPETARYSFDLLLGVDLDEVAAAQAAMGAAMRDALPGWRFRAGGTDLTCEVHDMERDAFNLGIDPPEIAPGLPRGVTMYFEAFLGHMDPDEPWGFRAEGVCEATGAIVAMGKGSAGIADQEDALRLVRQVAEHGATATVEDGVVTSCLVGGDDVVAELARLAGDGLGARVTECGMGINSSLPAALDRSVNSGMHEGTVGFHLGIGSHVTGCHFDLLCPGVQLEALAG